MRVRFSNHAVRQIDQALDYIAARSPQGERVVRERMQEVIATLADHPYAGHRTSWRGSRRLAISPYLFDHRLAGDTTFVTARGGHYYDLRSCGTVSARPWWFLARSGR